jgi:hypothetical protein
MRSALVELRLAEGFARAAGWVPLTGLPVEAQVRVEAGALLVLTSVEMASEGVDSRHPTSAGPEARDPALAVAVTRPPAWVVSAAATWAASVAATWADSAAEATWADSAAEATLAVGAVAIADSSFPRKMHAARYPSGGHCSPWLLLGPLLRTNSPQVKQRSAIADPTEFGH